MVLVDAKWILRYIPSEDYLTVIIMPPWLIQPSLLLS